MQIWGEKVGDVFEQIKHKIRGMYNLTDIDLESTVEMIESVMKMCVLKPNQQIDYDDLDRETRKILQHLSSIEEHLLETEENTDTEG